MHSKRWSIGGAVTAMALVAGGVAVAAGPWPGLSVGVVTPDGSVRYAAKAAGSSTRVTAIRVRDGHVLRVASYKGTFGVPAVTINGVPGGLSADGRTLVLSEPPTYQGLRKQSRFIVLSTATFRLIHTVALRGEFGFDALSPDARTLYLIQHGSVSDPTSYSVRAYDLRTGRLFARAIVDKSEADQTMRGYPVARATSVAATWVYTLYRRDSARPFIHALNTRARYAVCIDLPRQGSVDYVWNARLELTSEGRLLVKMPDGTTIATVDTQTLRIVTS